MPTPLPESLGTLIRTHRLRAGLTQEDLAERSGLSARAISDLERSLRTAPRMETLRMLAGAMNLSGEQRSSLFAAARPVILDPTATLANLEAPSAVSDASDPQVANRRRELPIPPTRLVGREPEVSQLIALLESGEVRLITLTGPAGVGKTRLGNAVASAVASWFSDGVAFVDLTPAGDASLVPLAVAGSLGIQSTANRPPIDAVCHALQNSALLLLIDNFEHLLDAAPVVLRLLESCENLRVIVTSRERLNLRGEHMFPVVPLALPAAPESASTSLSSVAEYPAVQLFLDRAREVRAGLELTNNDALPVAQICQRLDGLPLAIELAASRMRYESAAKLLARLDRRLPILTGGARDLPQRQQTLRDAIAWSYDLLPPAQQMLFRTLCVFPGGFTLEAATYITDRQAARIHDRPLSSSWAPSEPLSSYDPVISLMEHSFIQQNANSEQPIRFAILESVREYGLDLLVEHGEELAARQDFLSWFVSLTETPHLEALDGYLGTGPFSLPAEQDNLRAALAISIEHGDLASGVRIALSLSPFWWEHGLYAEAQSALEQILARGDALDPVVLGIVHGWAAEWAWLQSDYRRTRELAGAALLICRSVGHEAGAAANLYRLGRIATVLDPPAAKLLLQEALDVNRRLGNEREAVWTLVGMGYAAVAVNDIPSADAYFEEASAQLHTLEHPLRGGLAVSCAQARSWTALLKGNLEEASQILEQSVIDSREQKFEYGESNELRLLGRIARERGYLEDAVSLQLEALRLSQHQGALRRECYCLVEMASIAVAKGQPTRAARLLGAEASLRAQLGLVYTPDERETLSRTRAAAMASLGETKFSQEWQSGGSLRWDARLAEAALLQSTAPSENQR